MYIIDQISTSLIVAEIIIPTDIQQFLLDRTKAVTQYFLENSFKKLSIKRK